MYIVYIQRLINIFRLFDLNNICFVCFFLKVIASVLNTNNSKKNQIIMTKYQFLLKKKKAEN